jgi:hypothetical protein
MTTRLPIVNFKTGMNTYLQPEVLPDDGFPDIEDAIAYRGVVKKRDGYTSLIVPQAGATILVSAISKANPASVTTTAPHGLVSHQQVYIVGVQGMTQIGFQQTISAITYGPITTITTAGVHGYYSGQKILISGITIIGPNPGIFINGIYTITVVSTTTFFIPLYTSGLVQAFTGGITTALNPYTITVTGASTFTLDGIDSTGFTAYTGGGMINSIPYMGYIPISTITTGSPTTITTTVAHNLTSGQQVQISNVIGVTTDVAGEISDINNDTFSGPIQPYTVTVTGATTFTIPRNTTGDQAYKYLGTIFQPVMGLFQGFNQGNEFFPILIAFNESQAFSFTDNIQDFTNISGGTTWTGNDSQFFWSANYQGSFWATNNNDNIRYYISGTTWTNFTPQTDSTGTTVSTCLLIFPYKDRLVFLNTTENVGGSGNITFPQRARWSQNGTAYVGAPFPSGGSSDVNAWRQDIIGKGGYIDAPTSEQIVTAGFVRDTLVVMFERSAWRLRYTANEFLPFVWERIDSTYGSQSTNSNVTFDTGLMSVGKYGITMTTVNACERIDYQIADQVFNIEQTNAGNARVYGLRDYQRQLVYWLYPDSSSSFDSPAFAAYYPNRAFVYNYIEQNWALYNLTMTVLGQYRKVTAATWGSINATWGEYDVEWGSGFDELDNPQVISGDPFGQVFEWQPGLTMQNTLPFSWNLFGTPFNFSVTTKKFNPFALEGAQAKSIYLYMLTSGTQGGQFTVQHFIDENTDSPIETFPGNDPVDPEDLMVPFSNPSGLTLNTNTTTGQEKVWRRVALSGTSQYHQFTFTFGVTQTGDPYNTIPFSVYNIYQMIFEVGQSGRLNYGDDTTP